MIRVHNVHFGRYKNERVVVFSLFGASTAEYYCLFAGDNVIIPFAHREDLVPLSEEQKFEIRQQVAAALGELTC